MLYLGDPLNQLAIFIKNSTFPQPIFQEKYLTHLATFPGFISLFCSMQNQLVQNNLPLQHSNRSFRHLFWPLYGIDFLWPLSAYHLMFPFAISHPCTCSRNNNNHNFILILTLRGWENSNGPTPIRHYQYQSSSCLLLKTRKLAQKGVTYAFIFFFNTNNSESGSNLQEYVLQDDKNV